MSFTDPLDQASHLADMHNQRSLEAHRAKAAPEQVQRADGSWPFPECCDCGDEIEPERLQHGRIRCFSCQRLKENRERMYRK